MAQHDKYHVLIPDSIYAPLASGFVILVVGMLGVVFHRPWLFASLGPTAFQLAEYPELKSSRIYNVFVGHSLGLAMGFAAVALMHARGAPKVLMTHNLTLPRVWASVLALILTSAAMVVLRASHPPAGATGLLVALGSFDNFSDVAIVTTGVAIVGVVGEIMRFIRLKDGHHDSPAVSSYNDDSPTTPAAGIGPPSQSR
jgi:hypothetical protein